MKVVLNTEVDEALVEKEKPGAVILATGALPATPPIPGADLPHVLQAWDVLDGKVRTGRRVVILGGGAVGVETALLLADKGTLSGDALKFLLLNRAEDPQDLYELASRGSKDVLVVEMIDKVGKDIGKSTRWAMMQDAKRAGIATRTATKALEITETGIRVEAGEGVEEIPADTVVLAAGAKSHNPLQQTLEKKGIPVTVAGDARQLAKAFEAIHQGFEAGRSV